MSRNPPETQNDSDESLTAEDFPGSCPDCGKILGTVQAYSSHTCDDTIIEATDDAQLVADGGLTFELELTSENDIPESLEANSVTHLAKEAILDGIDRDGDDIEAAVLFLIGTDSDFVRPTGYAISDAYGIEIDELWSTYHDLRAAIDRRYAILLAKERFEYEAKARVRLAELKEKELLQTGNDADGAELVADGGVDVSPNDLTRFKIDILAVLSEEARYGLAVKKELETRYGCEVNHGRLYPNLNQLADEGLVTKRPLDERTNEYALTDQGRAFIGDLVSWYVERTSYTRAGELPQEEAAADGGREGVRDE